jgi:Ca-activated chloride channel homolog
MSQEALSLARLLVAAATIAVAACGSGGGDSSPSPAPLPPAVPAIQVLPSSFDFGQVTTNNVPAPLEVTIRNTGTAALNVSAISLLAPSGSPFGLTLNAGTKPCGGSAASVAIGDSCTVQVTFQPPTAGPFTSTLQITSNAQASPTVTVPISGTSAAVTSLTLRINQLEFACPSRATTAYVSVIDQGGFPLLGLSAANFLLSQKGPLLPAGMNVPITSAAFVEEAYKNVAISALLDFSKSLRDQPVAFADMKAGFSNFFGSLKPNDVAQVVRFATQNEVTQDFTTDVAALRAAIELPFDKGDDTRLYDTVFLGIDNVANSRTTYPGYRGVVIVATDGVNQLPSSAPSVRTLQQVIANARSKNVPIFTIGIGAAINSSVLSDMATQTGGLFYQANTSQNLATIYQQIAPLIFAKQYVIKFDHLSGTGIPSELTLGPNVPGVSGSPDTKPLTPC